MKAFKRLLLALLGVFMTFPGIAADFTFTSGSATLTYTTLDATTCAVKAGQTTTATTIVVPAQVGNYTVTQIADDAFKGRTTLETITLSPTITTIGTGAFSGCTNLTKIYLGSNIASIGASAFASDTKLAHIYITAQTPPAIQTNTFPAQTAFTTTPTLHLQGTNAETAYKAATGWSAFTKRVQMNVPTSMTAYNGVNVYSGSPLTANAGGKATHNFFLADGATVKYTASVKGTSLDASTVFWKSSNPTAVAVDADGNISMKKYPGADVLVTAESIYANGPVVEVTISGGYPYTANGTTLFYRDFDDSALTCAVMASADKSITSVEIPEQVTVNGKTYTVTGVGYQGFMSCRNLTDVKLPNTMTKLGYRAFYLTGIETIELPTSITMLDGDVFKETPLKAIVIPNSVTRMGVNVFDGCTELTDVTLSSGLTSIGNKTFQGCTSLVSVVIPPSVKTIGASAFSGCKLLESVYMGPNVATWRESVFEGCEKLADIYITAQAVPKYSSTVTPAPQMFAESLTGRATLHVQGEDAKSLYQADDNWGKFTIETVTLPTSMQAYNQKNVYNTDPLIAEMGGKISHLYRLADGESVKYTVSMLPKNSTPLNTIFWKPGTDNSVYVDAGGTITMQKYNGTEQTVTAESMYAGGPTFEVAINGSYAYTHNGQTLCYTDFNEENLTCNVMASSDKTITSVEIPEQVSINGKTYTVTGIGYQGFMSCRNLTDVKLPNTMTKLGYRAFYLTGIETIELPTSITTLDGDVFKETPLKAIVIPNSVTRMGVNVFDGCTELTDVTLSSGITNIGNKTFQNCTSLVSVVIPPSVKTIGASAFSGCKLLESVYMGPNIATWRESVFDGCEKLAHIYITAQAVPKYSSTVTPAPAMFAESLTGRATLHVQGDDAMRLYNEDANWGKFTIETVTLPTSMQAYNQKNVYNTDPLIAEMGGKISHLYRLADGESVKYTVSLLPKNSTPLNTIFWKPGTDNSVYVDAGGTITMQKYNGTEQTVTAESMYAGGPTFEVAINGSYAYTHNGQTLCYTDFNEENLTCNVMASSDKTITSVEIPEQVSINGKTYTVTGVGYQGFMSCRNLTDVKLPNTMTKLGYRAFYLTGIETIELPTSITTLDGDVFKETPLKAIVIPNSVTRMGVNVFDGCTELTDVTLSSGLTSIGNKTFQNCTSLVSVVIPPSVKTIGASAFSGCKLLESVYMGPNVATWRESVFDGCAKLAHIYITAQAVPKYSSTVTPAPAMFAESLTGRATLHVQGDDAKRLYEEDANWGKFTIETVTLPSSMQAYNQKNVYNTNPLVADFGQMITHFYQLPDYGDVTYRVSLRPADTTPLNTIFWSSEDYKSVYVDHQGKINMDIYSGSEVKVTAQSMYAEGPRTEITINGAYPYTYKGQTLYYCDFDDEAATCNVTSSSDKSMTSIEVPEQVEINGKVYTVSGVGYQGFTACRELTEVKLPSTIKKLRYRAFYATGIEEIALPAGLNHIDGDAFKETPLKSVVIPNSVTTIGVNAFEGCTRLTDVTLSSGLTAIANKTFLGCSALVSLVIPPAVRSIGNFAFSGCTALKSIYIGPNVATWREGVFDGTTNLEHIYITAQTAPAYRASSDPVPAMLPTALYNGATLHVQGDKALDAYKKHEQWGKFTKEVKMTKPHVEMKLEMAGGSTKKVRRKADVVTTTEDHIYGLTGQTHQRTATLVGESDEAVEIPNVFWSSDNTSKVYAAHDGTITINEAPDLHQPVTVTAQSLYANAPVRTVTIDHEMMTGVEAVTLDDEALDLTHGHIFTPEGVYVGESVNTLTPGVYILRQGDRAYKIYVK